jgi:acetate kinase
MAGVGLALPGAIAALNAGSSSVKFALYAATAEPELIARGEVEHDEAGQVEALIEAIEARLGDRQLVAAGHRIVHGGPRFAAPVPLTAEILAELRALTPLAPLHQPRCLAPAEALARRRPGLLQVACFDTAFHHGLRPPVSRYGLPRSCEARGIRRYGFHGLSYEYIAGRLDELSTALRCRRTGVALLGSGASLCAMRDGQSIDTTMGFSALDGLVMATRPGAIDPGILLFLLQQDRMSPGALEDLLYHRSGLLGVSGLSSDMRALLDSDDPRAAEAVELFVFRISREVAAMANSLEGLEVLVFTGGIGEHAAPVRAMVCRRLGWLGVRLDEAANARTAGRIDTAESAVEVRIMSTDEELMLARHTRRLMPD